MIIGYARLSGSISLSHLDSGTRGLWLEKRIALIKEFERRGHTVKFLTKLSKNTDRVCESSEFDLLWVEFGGLNIKFYGDQIMAVINRANNFKGPKVFFSDDPDLHFLWDLVKNPRQWFGLYNCENHGYFPKHPSIVQSLDFPVSGLQETHTPSVDMDRKHFVYIGRPGGRGVAIRYLLSQNAPVKFYAKENEYSDIGVECFDPPEQSKRQEFYNKSLACLCLTDQKHKDLKFRTGRAYHAALSGCPVVCERDNAFLISQGFNSYASAYDLKGFQSLYLDSPDERDAAVFSQQNKIKDLKRICDLSLSRLGL